MCRVGYRRVDAPDMPDAAGVLKILFGVPAAAQVLKILIHHRIHGKTKLSASFDFPFLKTAKRQGLPCPLAIRRSLTHD